MLTVSKPWGKKNRQASAGNQVIWMVKEPNKGKSTLSHADAEKNQSNVPHHLQTDSKKKKITGNTLTSILPVRSGMQT